MTGAYPNPFLHDAGAACALTCAMTLGPCYAETIERQDISEGYTGLPVRLALRVVDEDCNPVEGAKVDVWHAAPGGLYSGSDAAQMCTTGDADMKTHRYFRGVLTTDADGRVDFNTCFPGWYASRAVHIHFQVRVGDQEYVTSQLFFPDALIEEICASHPDYAAYGQPDTPNASDKVLGDNDPALYTLSTARMGDGAMQAYKTLSIRSSLGDSLCTAPQAGR